MHWNVDPCIIYQRLRPSAPEASELARQAVWPLADELVEHKGYTVCSLYGDSEFAPPFCGSSEIRPGFELALTHAKEVAAKLGTCTLIVGDASPIGDGDPFLPAHVPPDASGNVDIVLVNFHLRPSVIAFPLRSAWRYFDRRRKTQKRPHFIEPPPELVGPGRDIEVFVRRDPERLLAHLYVANPTDKEIALDWKQLMRRPGQNAADMDGGEWRPLDIHGGFGSYLETIYQGDLPWVRQLRFKREEDGRRLVGSLHLTPSDMTRDRLPLIWEETE